MALSSGGIAWYDGQGDATDSIGSNDLSYGGSFESGLIGQTMAIDDWGEKAHDGTFSLGDSDFTVALWWKPDALATTYLCAKGGAGQTSREFVFTHQSDFGNDSFKWFNPSTSVGFRTVEIQAGTWVCLVGRYDASTDTITLDGRKSTDGSWSTASSTLAGGMSGDSGDAPFTLGARVNTFASNDREHSNNGPIDSWTIYNRKWTDAERDEYYNGGSGVSYSDVASTETTYTVSGAVTESDGTTAINGATVTLDNVAGANAQSTTTDANGNYSLSVTVSDSDLPDTWDVTADASGFTAQTKQVSADTSSTSYTTDFSLDSIFSNTLTTLGV